MKAKSINGNSTAATKAELESNMTDGFSPTPAIAFNSKAISRTTVTKVLEEKENALFGYTAHSARWAHTTK